MSFSILGSARKFIVGITQNILLFFLFLSFNTDVKKEHVNPLDIVQHILGRY